MKKIIFAIALTFGMNALAAGLPPAAKIFCSPDLTQNEGETYTLTIDSTRADGSRLAVLSHAGFSDEVRSGLSSQILTLLSQNQGTEVLLYTADKTFTLTVNLESFAPREEGDPYLATMVSDVNSTHVEEKMGCLLSN